MRTFHLRHTRGWRFAYLVSRLCFASPSLVPLPPLSPRYPLYHTSSQTYTFVRHPSPGLRLAHLLTTYAQPCVRSNRPRLSERTAPQVPVWRAGRAEYKNPRTHHHEGARLPDLGGILIRQVTLSTDVGKLSGWPWSHDHSSFKMDDRLSGRFK
jgi:hypothetical protein